MENVEAGSASGGAPRRLSGRISELGAIGFALAGFTFWVLTDTSVKLVGPEWLWVVLRRRAGRFARKKAASG